MNTKTTMVMKWIRPNVATLWRTIASGLVHHKQFYTLYGLDSGLYGDGLPSHNPHSRRLRVGWVAVNRTLYGKARGERMSAWDVAHAEKIMRD